MLYGIAMLKTLQNCSDDPKYKVLDEGIFGEALLLHDVGKLSIPNEILMKPQRLQVDEFEVMKKHPKYGELEINQNTINEKIGFEEKQMILDVVKYHHERVDGTGYPYGLSDQEIPLAAKICQIADVYDAITSDRPYSHGKQVDDALAMIQDMSGTQLDKQIVTVLINNDSWKNAAIPYKQTF